MLNIYDILELIHEVDIEEEHPTFVCKFSKGEYQGLGTLTINERADFTSIRIEMTASLKGTFVNVVQWKEDVDAGETFCLTELEERALEEALEPIFDEESFSAY